MIYLHQYPSAYGLPSLSPFCVKVLRELVAEDVAICKNIHAQMRPGDVFTLTKFEPAIGHFHGLLIEENCLGLTYDVVAFDLDGTLIDSKPSIVYGIQKLCEQLNISALETGELRKLIGLPLPDIFSALAIDNDFYELHRSTYSEHMYQHMRSHMKAFPAVNDTLKALKERGYRIALVTSRGRDSLLPCLELAGIDAEHFELMIARDDTKSHKPSPEPLLLAIDKLGCEPHRLVYVGDAHVDVSCASAAGCHAIFASYDADVALSDEHQVVAEIGSFDELMTTLIW